MAGASMPFNMHAGDARRRWLGLFCLAIAGGMLIWGIVVFGTALRGVGFLLYWAVCFAFTLCAIFIALIDMRAMRRRIREEQDDLIRMTIDEIHASKPKQETDSTRESAPGTGKRD